MALTIYSIIDGDLKWGVPKAIIFQVVKSFKVGPEGINNNDNFKNLDLYIYYNQELLTY